MEQETISLIAQLLVFIGFIFGVLKFAQEKKREFQKRFFEEQLKVFSEVIDNTAVILVYEKKDQEYNVAVKNFKRLYWGKMCLVEDKEVEAKMCNFSNLLDIYNESDSKALKSDLKKAQLNLAHTFRNSFLNTWKVKNDIKNLNNYGIEQ
ncbi:MAG: hypothetical protein ABIP27_02695 [Flavobacterium circumlabens]|uniref:hypothetical protein n=1 Tax=Flavobacterium circumlabens TaxID=2133765 RepID=UPI0032677870